MMNEADSAHVCSVIADSVSRTYSHIRDVIESLPIYAASYRLVPYRDGNQWCVLLGEDLQSGIAGFGDSPALAIADFERAMQAKAADAEVKK